MPTTVLLFTANHPFVREGGETSFLGSELDALACRTDLHVRIVPLRTARQRLDVPPGVGVDTTLASSFAHWRPIDLLLAWRWPGFGAEFARALRHGGPVGIVRVWRWAAVARSTWRWFRRHAPPEATLAYTYWRGGQTLAAARWAATGADRVAITRVHRYELYEDAFRPPFQPWVGVYSELGAIATVSQHGRAHLLARGVPAARLWLARLGTAPAARRARPSDDGVLRLVSCSFLRPEKRVPLLAQALVRLAQEHPGRRIVWTHLGDGPQRGAVEAELAGAPANLQACLAGAMSNPAVRAFYAEQPVDLFVQVSSSEGLPVAIMEALAAGVPVVATDVGGVAEAVDDEVGRLLPVAAPAAAVASAVAALGLQLAIEERRRMRDAAFARWAERFDAGRNHRDFGARIAQIARAAVPSPQAPTDAGS